jgi:hypothetical protein
LPPHRGRVAEPIDLIRPRTLLAKLQVPTLEESGYAGSLRYLEEGTPSCARASNTKIEKLFHGHDVDDRLGKGPVGLPEAGCAPRHP